MSREARPLPRVVEEGDSGVDRSLPRSLQTRSGEGGGFLISVIEEYYLFMPNSEKNGRFMFLSVKSNMCSLPASLCA